MEWLIAESWLREDVRAIVRQLSRLVAQTGRAKVVLSASRLAFWQVKTVGRRDLPDMRCNDDPTCAIIIVSL